MPQVERQQTPNPARARVLAEMQKGTGTSPLTEALANRAAPIFATFSPDTPLQALAATILTSSTDRSRILTNIREASRAGYERIRTDCNTLERFVETEGLEKSARGEFVRAMNVGANSGIMSTVGEAREKALDPDTTLRDDRFRGSSVRRGFFLLVHLPPEVKTDIPQE